MRGALWLTFLFAVAVIVALFASSNGGHITIYFPPYRLDTSLNLFIASILGIFIVSLLAWRTFAAVLDLPKQAAAYRRKQRETRSIGFLSEAIEDIFAGRFSKALKSAEAATVNSALAETAALLAARSAHRMNQFDVRDRWLLKIQSPEKRQAKLVATADMQMDAHDAEGALATIEQLQKGGARQLLVQRIALKANQQLKNWSEVLKLTHSLSKREALHPLVAQKYIQEAIAKLVQEKSTDHEALLRIWKTLPKESRKASKIALVMARGLLSVSQYDIARGLVEESLDAQWDEALIDIYPKCVMPGTSNLSLAQKLESWMIKYPSEPALSLALARICLDQQLWGKAKSSLVGVIRDPKTKPPMKAAAHMAMAQLHESLSESAEAAGEYQLAAKIYSKIVIDR
jgi:HemY protein